ncbi:hypothetical protein [Fusobacterium sp. PH5-44]|uniref:hypothetical protein n=1 Tax=unclassified Fusobacterium TaxID=2648384 RepID=UPI003D1A6388
MKKIFRYVILLIISLGFYSCSSVSEKNISTVRTNNSKRQLIVNYNSANISDVRIGGKRIESGVPYYLDQGKYFISYTNKVIISGTIGYNRNGRMRNSDTNNEDAIHVILDKDKTVDIEGHRYEINVTAGKSF